MDNPKNKFNFDYGDEDKKDDKPKTNTQTKTNKGQLDYIFNNKIIPDLKIDASNDLRFGQASRNTNKQFRKNREAFTINRFDYLDNEQNKVLPYNIVGESTREKKILPTKLNTRKEKI